MPTSAFGNGFTQERIRRWLSLVPDHRKLNEITMPGSHDAALTQGSAKRVLSKAGISPLSFTICQKYGIKEQCEVGSRFFDLRLMKIRGVICGYHAPIDGHVALGSAGESLPQILSDVYDFLSENPTEFILFRITHTKRSEGVIEFIKSHPIRSLLYKSKIPENISNCNIGALRGSLILIIDNKEFASDVNQRNGMHPHIKYKTLYDAAKGWTRVVNGLAICGEFSGKPDITSVIKKQEKRVDAHSTHPEHPAHLFMYYYTQTGMGDIRKRAMMSATIGSQPGGAITSGGTHDPINIISLQKMLSDMRSDMCGANIVLTDFVDELICWAIVESQLKFYRETSV